MCRHKLKGIPRKGAVQMLCRMFKLNITKKSQMEIQLIPQCLWNPLSCPQ